ncbi:MAG: hypothetical protein WBQ21_09670 [Solirubrobacteraceae bacterium]
MVDLGVAIAWIAISAASAKGLSAFARAARTNDTETELAAFAGDCVLVDDGPLHAIGVSPRLLHESR